MRACICAGPRTTSSMRPIAACAATVDRPRIEPDQRLAKLAQHLTFVEQIEEDIARLKVRIEHVDDPRLRRMVVTDIARLKLRRSTELLRLVTALRCHNDLGHRLDLVLSIPGLGERTASRSSSACRSSAALAARKPRRLPVSRPTTTTAASIRASDILPVVVGVYAARCSPQPCRLPSVGTKPSSNSTALIARGKAHTAALIACARKLLIYANTVVYRGTPGPKDRCRLMVATC